jgi:hypothetical protein
MRRVGAAAAVIVALGGCKQIIGYESPTVIGAAAACKDGVKDFGETDVDCGGETCPACADGKRCSVGADCEDKVCKGGACEAPTCHDGTKNGKETDVDCGGPACPKCSAGEACGAGSDCVGGICTAGKCASSCTDNAKDGAETDVDCGGGTCPGCAIGKDCAKNTDCDSGICTGGKCADFVVWAESFGPSGGASNLVGLGVDVTGDTVIAANFMGAASFGGPTYTADNQGFAFARYDSSGKHLWDAGFPGGSTFLTSLYLDAFGMSTSGAFAAAGTFGANLDLGHSDTFSGCIGWPKARRSPGKDSRSANRLGAGPA